MSATEEKPAYTGIVIMPYSSDKNPKRLDDSSLASKKYPDFGMTQETELATIAGLQAWEEVGGKEKNIPIILIGEHTFGSDKKGDRKYQHTTDEFMKEYLLEKGVPVELIKYYSGFDSTALQLKKLKEIITSDDKFLVICFKFHKDRIQTLIKGLELDVQVNSALVEDLLSNMEKEKYASLLKELHEHFKKRKVLRKEFFFNTFTWAFDRKGRIQGEMSIRGGPRSPLS